MKLNSMKNLISKVIFITLFVSNICFGQENNLLWEISGNQLEKPSYLFGTIHVICEEDYIMTPAISNSLKNVDTYFAELNLADISTMLKMQEYLKAEETLSKRITPKQYSELKHLLNEVFQLDIETFENLSDFAIMSTIMLQSFDCKNKKIYELELMQQALFMKKKLDGLETVEEQVNAMSNSTNIDSILGMLRDLKTDKGASSKKLIELYTSENIKEILNDFTKTSYIDAKSQKTLLDNRNKNWIPKMKQAMEGQSVFFAVGAAHLAGKKGVIRLLKKEGYTLKPIKLKE